MAKTSEFNQPRISERAEQPVKTTAAETRPGPLGRPVAIVLGCALVLVLVAWGAMEIWGESQDDAADVAPTAPSVTEPAGQTSMPSTGAASESQSRDEPGNTAPSDPAPAASSTTGGNSAVNAPGGTQPPATPQQ